MFNAILASPLEKDAIMYKPFSSISMFSLPNPCSLDKACFNKSKISSISRPCKTKTLHRDNRAELISKEGFSVVAPMRIMLPRST